MTILPFGDSAMLINFEQKIDATINERTVALSNAIVSSPIAGVSFCIPAYCSITLGYSPDLIHFKTLEEKIYHLNSTLSDVTVKGNFRRITIPVCYHENYAMDKNEVMRQTELAWENIVELHTSIEYRVYMLGFIAGFAYMGTLPNALSCNRKATPRMYIPAGTVGIAGLQTGIYPTRAHAGWQLIGRTPIPIFDVTAKSPFLFRPGDRVRFSDIDQEEFESIADEVDAGNLNINKYIKHT